MERHLAAVLIALLAAAAAPRLQLRRWRTAVLEGLDVGSHPLLDAMTESSRGVPLLWPFSFARFEVPWRPIPNAPCGLAFLSWTGLRVATVELIQFFPILLLALWPAGIAPKRAGTRKRDRGRAIPSPRPSQITRQAT